MTTEYFHKDKQRKDGYYSCCKECKNNQKHRYYMEHEKESKEKKDNAHQYYLEHKEHYAEISKQYRKENKSKIAKASKERAGRNRELQIKRKFNLTLDDYNTMINNQNNKCAICGDELKFGKLTAIDHSHTSGKVRGILCHNCNVAMGLLKENVNTLQSMITYLENS